jgi:hypothetical protein
MTPMTLFSPHSGGFRATRLTHLYASRTGGNNAESAAVFQKNSAWRYPSGRLPPGEEIGGKTAPKHGMRPAVRQWLHAIRLHDRHPPNPGAPEKPTSRNHHGGYGSGRSGFGKFDAKTLPETAGSWT